jgi:hypothetical protein
MIELMQLPPIRTLKGIAIAGEHNLVWQSGSKITGLASRCPKNLCSHRVGLNLYTGYVAL